MDTELELFRDEMAERRKLVRNATFRDIVDQYQKGEIYIEDAKERILTLACKGLPIDMQMDLHIIVSSTRTEDRLK